MSRIGLVAVGGGVVLVMLLLRLSLVGPGVDIVVSLIAKIALRKVTLRCGVVAAHGDVVDVALIKPFGGGPYRVYVDHDP